MRSNYFSPLSTKIFSIVINLFWKILLVTHKKHVSRSPCSCTPREKKFNLKDCFWHELSTFQILASNSQPSFSYSHHTILKILLLLVSHKKHVSRSHCSYAPREKILVLKDCFWHELTTFQILASNSQPFFSYSHHTILKIILLVVSHKKTCLTLSL